MDTFIGLCGFLACIVGVVMMFIGLFPVVEPFWYFWNGLIVTACGCTAMAAASGMGS